MNKKFIQDIMSQKFTVGTFANPTRLILLSFFLEGPELLQVYKRQSALEYIFQAYIDNPEIANRNPNVMIRNIGKYGLRDISPVLEEALFEWKSDAQNDLLSYDDNWIYLGWAVEEETLRNLVLTVQNMLYRKYFKISPIIPKVIHEEEVLADTDLDIFGKSIYRNRVLEDIQYCPLCEETLLSNLFAVHIISSSKGAKGEDLCTKYNGLLFCREHAEAFIKGEFSFNASGFVCKCTTNAANEKMHLSFNICSPSRKKYLKWLEALNN